MAEEFESAAATAELPAKEMPEEAAEPVGYDVDIDYNMEWEVETEPAEPDVIIDPHQRAADERQYSDGSSRVYRRDNKHLFVWLLSFVFGVYGADRFARGQVGMGVLKLLTFGGLGIWYLVDLIIAIVKAYSGEALYEEDLHFDVLGRYI